MSYYLIALVILIVLIFAIYLTWDLFRSLDFRTPHTALLSVALLYQFAVRPLFVRAYFPEHAITDQFILSWPTYLLGLTAALYYFLLNRGTQKGRDEDAAQTLRAIHMGRRPTFALYLRPFEVTGKIRVTKEVLSKRQQVVADAYGGPSANVDCEELLVEGVEPICRFVALGQPGEALGAGRIKTSESAWKSTIVELMENAALILIVPSLRKGTFFELQTIKNRGFLEKTIFLVPPSFSQNKWNGICNRFKQDDFEWHFPGESGEAKSRFGGFLLNLLCEPKTCMFAISADGKALTHELSSPITADSIRQAINSICERTNRPPIGSNIDVAQDESRKMDLAETARTVSLVRCPHCQIVVGVNTSVYPCCGRVVETEDSKS